MKYYDFKKAKEIIDNSKDAIQSASLGMHEDWFWTAQTVFENGAYRKDLFDGDIIAEEAKYREERASGLSLFSDKYEHILVGGICASNWATPTLQLVYLDGEDKMFPCYVQEGDEIPLGEKVAKQVLVTSGCLSSKVQEEITPLTY